MLYRSSDKILAANTTTLLMQWIWRPCTQASERCISVCKIDRVASFRNMIVVWTWLSTCGKVSEGIYSQMREHLFNFMLLILPCIRYLFPIHLPKWMSQWLIGTFLDMDINFIDHDHSIYWLYAFSFKSEYAYRLLSRQAG